MISMIHYQDSAWYLRWNFVSGPAALIHGSFVWKSASMTNLPSNTRQLSLMAEMNRQMNPLKELPNHRTENSNDKKITFKSVVVNLLGLEAKERLEN